MDYSDILYQGYKRFVLNVYGKQIHMPYRINIPPDPHPKRQGKSSPQDILKQLKQDALQQGFDLKPASIEETRQFMINNKLGIDCSGFAYRMLDYLLLKLQGKRLKSFLGSHVGNTDVRKLTSAALANRVEIEIKPGDLIKIDSALPIPHCMVILNIQDGQVTYAHSSKSAQGVNLVTKSLEEISQNWNTQAGDGIYRLKILENQSEFVI